MKKIYIILIGALVTTGLLSSCNKKDNDWNLNDAPSAVLDSIVVNGVTLTAGDLSKGKSVKIDTVGVVNVQLHFTAVAGNELEQISFHDGTWDANMTMVINNETVTATPPSSKYRLDGQGKKEVSFVIDFPDLTAETIFSMFVFDGNGMSGDFEYKLEVPSDITI
jgi:hypothetical protein